MAVLKNVNSMSNYALNLPDATNRFLNVLLSVSQRLSIILVSCVKKIVSVYLKNFNKICWVKWQIIETFLLCHQIRYLCGVKVNVLVKSQFSTPLAGGKT